MHLRPPVASAAVRAKAVPLDVANPFFIIATIVCLDFFKNMLLVLLCSTKCSF